MLIKNTNHVLFFITLELIHITQKLNITIPSFIWLISKHHYILNFSKSNLHVLKFSKLLSFPDHQLNYILLYMSYFINISKITTSTLQTNIMAFFFQYVRRNIDDISICPLVPHIGTTLMSYSTYHNAFHAFHYVVHHCIIFSTHVTSTQRMEYESNAYYYYLSHIIIVFLH